MHKLMKAIHKNEKGFTLVELMVVVVIIGILVAIAIPIYGAVSERAQLGACEANRRTTDGTISMWQMEDETRLGTAPADFAALVDFLPNEPVCPSGGGYTLGDGTAQTSCSWATPDHTADY